MKRIVFLLLVLLVSTGTIYAQTTIRLQTWHLMEKPWLYGWEEFKVAVEKKYPDIKIQFEPVTYGEKEMVFTSQSEAKMAADIASFSYRPIPVFIEKGYPLDLTPYIEREPGFKEKFLEKPLAIATKNGRIYALPDDHPIIILVYNKEMFRAAGLDPNKPPETWDQLVKYAKKLTRDTDGDGKLDQWGYGLIGKKEEGMFMRLHPWFWGAGGDYLTPDGKHSALNTKESLIGFKFYTDLVTKHKVVPPGAIEMGCQDVRTQLAHEKVAMIVGTAWTPPIIDKINPKFNAAKKLAFASIPAYKAGQKPYTSCWIGMRVISAFTKHPEEAWKVFRYIYSDENQARWFKWMKLPSSQKHLRNSDMVLRDKFSSVAAEAAETHVVKYEPLIPEWPEIGDAMITAVQETITGRKDAKEALLAAHERVEGIMGR